MKMNRATLALIHSPSASVGRVVEGSPPSEGPQPRIPPVSNLETALINSLGDFSGESPADPTPGSSPSVARYLKGAGTWPAFAVCPRFW